MLDLGPVFYSVDLLLPTPPTFSLSSSPLLPLSSYYSFSFPPHPPLQILPPLSTEVTEIYT